MLTKELVKENIDLFNCLGLDGGGVHERAKVLFEFDAQHHIPGGLAILISSSYNNDIGDENFNERDTRSVLVIFLEGKGFIANICYQAWSENVTYRLYPNDKKLILLKNYRESVVKKSIKYEFDPLTKKFSYHNGKEIINVDSVDEVEIDYYQVSGKNVFDFEQFDNTIQNERFIYLSFNDIEPAFCILKADIVELLAERNENENIDVLDGGWIEYPDEDEDVDKLFTLINESLDAGGGEEEIEKICDNCRNDWEEDDED